MTLIDQCMTLAYDHGRSSNNLQATEALQANTSPD